MPFPVDLLSQAVDLLGIGVASTRENVLELAAKGVLFETLDLKGDVSRLLVRKPTVHRSDRKEGNVASLLDDNSQPGFTCRFCSAPLVMQRCYATYLAIWASHALCARLNDSIGGSGWSSALS